jgi:hypothetical protein
MMSKTPLRLHPGAVGGGGPSDGEAWHGGGLLHSGGLIPDFDGRAVEGQLETVDVIVHLVVFWAPM